MFRRRRAAGHAPTPDPLGGRTIEELDAEDDATAERELADFDPETRAEIKAGWRRGRRSLALSQVVQERVYHEPPAQAPEPPTRSAAPAIIRRTPAARPAARRPGRRSGASSRTSSADPGDSDGSEPEPPAGFVGGRSAAHRVAMAWLHAGAELLEREEAGR